MEHYIFAFRREARRVDTDLLDYDEFVNNFMYANKLYGEDIYNKLMEELKML